MTELLLIVKKLTVRKIINLLIRNFCIFLTKISGRLIIKGMPWSYSIEPTNICNLKCKECVSGLGMIKRRRGNLKMEDFKKAADQIAPWAVNCFLYFQGEPFINQDFTEMIKYADSKGIFIATSTNGHFIDYDTAKKISISGLDKIIVSLDGYNQESYSAYRVNGNYERVIQSIKHLAQAKKDLNRKNPVIEVQTIVNKINEKHLTKIKQTAKEAGADIFALKTMQIEIEKDFNTFKTNIDKYSRYDANNKLKHKIGFCNRILNSAVITIDLDVLPCCYDKDAELKLGNLRNTDLKTVLTSDCSIKLYKKIEFQRPKRPAMCSNCGG